MRRRRPEEQNVRIPNALRWLCGALCLLAAAAASAQSCAPPVPFQYFSANQVQATWTAATASDPCALNVAVNSGAGPSAAGFVHYQRLQPLTLARYGFRVDTTALAGMALANRVVQLFSASSPTPVPAQSIGFAQLRLAGSASGPLLTLIAACSACGPAGSTFGRINLPAGVHNLRIEVATGAGTAGVVRLWIDHAFSDPPDLVVDNAGAGLDNAAAQGVIAAEIGLSSTSNAFRTDFGGANVTFDQLESNDDVLFFSDFSGGGQ
jgi:hypothetical protein